MAINIFQGSKPVKGKGSSSSSSVRAKNAQAALTVPSATSDSGSVAVGKSGTLAKVGNIVGNVAGIASKFLPGIGGTIAKGIANVFNDPEWWRSVPGDAVTLNAPLRPIFVGTLSITNDMYKGRFAIAEFNSTVASDTTHTFVIEPSDTAITQYLLPEIRKVVNAIPLQTAQVYKEVLQANATLYAIWQNLKRDDYLLKHGQTYIANLDDPAFPIFQVANAAKLQSMIGRLEEYLRANVRLPHTLCEYLAWRYGRVYKSNSSAKSALVLYNVVSIRDLTTLESLISQMISLPSSTPAHQQANADLYNAYYDHDYNVVIRDDTQFSYDVKEFCLRTNLDLSTSWPTGDAESLDCVYIDSALDNPTTFMASTVSTIGVSGSDGITISWLFPVRTSNAFIPGNSNWQDAVALFNDTSAAGNHYDWLARTTPGSLWYYAAVSRIAPSAGSGFTDAARALAVGMLCKSLDIYNKDVYVPIFPIGPNAPYAYWDVTALSMDLGTVQNNVLGNEHVYAFANLAAIGRKHSMSYKEAETLVARDTANLVERLDIGMSK